MSRNSNKSRKGNRTAPKAQLKVCELFAGVGGFHLGLKRGGHQVIWANQWEPPGGRNQFAFECYEAHFGKPNSAKPATVCVNEDIADVIRLNEARRTMFPQDLGAGSDSMIVPEHDLLVGGFPCQDYSVAKPLSQASGLEGKKGVLWWQIYKWLELFKPRFLVLENVDRLLKSPSSQRGRDFAVMLGCLAQLGYAVEWRVINAADYGFPQKRRRVFIFGERLSKPDALCTSSAAADRLAGAAGVKPSAELAESVILRTGLFARAFPATARAKHSRKHGAPMPMQHDLPGTSDDAVREISEKFGVDDRTSFFKNAGYMLEGRVWTMAVDAKFSGKHRTLGSILVKRRKDWEPFLVDTEAIPRWKVCKGAKKQSRVDPKTGFEYDYSEGAIPFPDRIDGPARTILTSEGGISPSRTKHIVPCPGGKRYRRLTPVELEKLNGFPANWTDMMPDNKRAFCMGNALVVGLVQKIGGVLATYAAQRDTPSAPARRSTAKAQQRA